MATRNSKKQASAETLVWELCGWGEEGFALDLYGANKSAPTPGFFPGEPEASVKAVVEPPCQSVLCRLALEVPGAAASEVRSLLFTALWAPLSLVIHLQLPSWGQVPKSSDPPASTSRVLGFLTF